MAENIFTNLKDLDELTTLDYLSEEQIMAIKHYFGVFEVKSDSELKQKFLNIWNLLYPTYQKFRERLFKNKLAYEGMLRRHLVENTIDSKLLKSKTFVFVGFNVLNKTEIALLDTIKKEGKALFYWDYDKAYVNQNGTDDCFFEAGRFVWENLRRFGCEIKDDSTCYDNMKSGKKISFVASPSNSAETRFAGEWLEENIKADELQHQTAVVLCDEKMLQSMLHSMPEKDKEQNGFKMNVTMGFPLFQTPIAAFLMTLLELQVGGERNGGYWYFTHVANVLKHPYAVRMSGGESVNILQTIKKKNLFFISSQLFDEIPFLKKLFVKRNTIDEILALLAEVTQEIGLSCAESDNHSFDNQLYQESLYCTFTLLNRLVAIREMILNDRDFQVIKDNDMSNDKYLRLFRQMLQSTSVPFHGEPAEGIQIIGLLETRCLDFENVIVAGVNDENIPKTVKRTSFIPYTLREAHGMTTLEARSSLFAYSFYHLIQRASQVTLIYNNTVDDFSKGEMSRYMTQLLVEQEQVFGPESKIERVALEARVTPNERQEVTAPKSQQVIRILTEKFQNQFFSPTAINTYIDCPFKFYLKVVAGLKPDNEIKEEVGNDVFGNIFHYCMEQLYKPYIGKTLNADLLEQWSRNEQMIENVVDEAFRAQFFKVGKNQNVSYNGEQMLNKMVICKYVKKQLLYDSNLCPLRIDGVENRDYELTLDINGHNIKIGGVIDRIDTIYVGDPNREQHRIVDYKTSARAQTFQKIEDLFNSNHKKRPYHILQTFYYADIYTEKCHQPVAPALMYIKPAILAQNSNKVDGSIIKYGEGNSKTPILNFAIDYKEEFHNKMIAVLKEIFSQDVGFKQCENEETCKKCDFCQICNREPEKEHY